MNEYNTEDQQIEAVKKWLKENFSSMVFGLSLGVLALVGWNYYTGHRNNHAIKASNLYMTAAQLIAINGVNEEVIDISNQLNNDYEDTPYAVITSLLMASKEYEKGDVSDAIEQLKWAEKHATTDEIKQIATLRLSRVLIGEKKYDKAMAYLNKKHAASFDASYEELKGDVYVAKGQLAEARRAYDKAISLNNNADKWLMLKRENLGSGNSSSNDTTAS